MSVRTISVERGGIVKVISSDPAEYAEGEAPKPAAQAAKAPITNKGKDFSVSLAPIFPKISPIIYWAIFWIIVAWLLIEKNVLLYF